ncbi:MAG TPA: YceI family protein [Gammaproteobacteria bacterium]
MRKFLIPLLLFAVALASCRTAPTHPGSSAPSGEVGKAAAGAAHYQVDPARSDVRFLVYKAGALSAFGYNHVILAKDFKGDVYLAKDFGDSSFTLVLPVKSFVVDEPEARAHEGADFAKQPSPQAVKGTTEHMLGPEELDAEHYSEVRVESVKFTGGMAKAEATVRVTLHGTARDLKVPVTVTQDGDDLSASGEFKISQAEFGITPHSALGGAMAVADVVAIKFRIVARKG